MAVWSLPIALTAAALLVPQEVAPLDARYPDALPVYHCPFDSASDPNYDRWPSGWTRRAGSGYPHYVKIALAESDSPEGNLALDMHLDGGAAAAFSPPIEIHSAQSYVLEAYLKTSGIQRDVAYFSVTFLDAAKNVLQTIAGQRIRATDGWKKLRLGPIAPSDARARLAMIGLHVTPDQGQDLHAQVAWDDIWLASLPRVEFRLSRPDALFFNPADVEIDCQVSGLTGTAPRLRFELVDQLGQPVDEHEFDLQAAAPRQRVTAAANADELPGQKYAWKPRLQKYGYYRARAMLVGEHGTLHERRQALVVLRASSNTPFGEFGWSLPQGDQPLPVAPLAEVLGQAGVNWITFPLWYGADEQKRFQDALWLIDHLRPQGIETVGLLTPPPAAIREQLGLAQPRANDVFFAPASLWYPSLEQVMLSTALRIRWWQLGVEGDLSLVGYPDLVERLATLRTQLEGVGRDARLVIPWNCLHAPPAAPSLPWQALTISSQPPLAAPELAHQLASEPDSPAERWVVLEPLDQAQYDQPTRVLDLVERMVSARIGNAQRIVVPNPFHPTRGLWDAQGLPGELFMPWRNTAVALRGAEYLGSLVLPANSTNHVFSRPGGAVILLHHDRPVEEPLALGSSIEHLDLWGNALAAPRRDDAQIVSVGTVPSFVQGWPDALARLQTSLEVSNPQLPSLLDTPHRSTLRLRNPFTQPLSGTVELTVPPTWRLSNRKFEVNARPDQVWDEPFAVTLTYDSETTGRHLLRMDFDVTADRRYQFTVYRELTVESGTVELDTVSRLNERGDLELDVRLINRADEPVRFNCDLFVPGRRHQRIHLAQPGRGEVARSFRIRSGAELIGQTLRLRAVEVGGRMALNRTIVAEP